MRVTWLGWVGLGWVGLAVFGGCVETLPIPEGFDAVEATEFAHLAVSGYDMRQASLDGEDWEAPEGYALLASYTTQQNWNDLSSEAEAVPVAWLGERDRTLYLVFRGTSTSTEALLDLNAVQVDYPLLSGDGGGTHQGFTWRYQDVHEEIAPDVMARVDAGDVDRIAVTGHSLGGAVATLAAATLAERSGLPVTAYTFASPRVGDEDFVDRYHALVSDSWRITNPRDVVPGTPEESPFGPDSAFADLFYEHVGLRVDVPFDDADGHVETGLSLTGNHSSCRYLEEVCELQGDDVDCAAEVARHPSCSSD